jgi:uncharacterized phiE125 gp8 family phage protein
MLRSTRYSEEPSGRTIEPVTIAEVRKQLRLDHGEDDADLADMIVEARRECEAVKLGNRALIDGTITEYFDSFDDEMELRWSPVDSITSVKYWDTTPELQTLTATVYELGGKYNMGILRLAYDQSWPTLIGHTADDVIVEYKAGWGATRSAVPLGIRRWIKARAAWLYENRDGEVYPWKGMDALLSPFATARVVG